MAAGMPFPLTSPTAIKAPPEASGMTWKKSPPTWPAGLYTQWMANPGTGGISLGMRTCCTVRADSSLTGETFFVTPGSSETQGQDRDHRDQHNHVRKVIDRKWKGSAERLRRTSGNRDRPRYGLIRPRQSVE